jgi:sugar transferase (PEP-CTERM system associated)
MRRDLRSTVYRVWLICVLEGGTLWLAGLAAYWIARSELDVARPPSAAHLASFASCCLLWMAALGLHSSRMRESSAGVFGRVAFGLIFGSISTGVLAWLLPGSPIAATWILSAAALALLPLLVARAAWTRLSDDSKFRRRVLVLGAGNRATSVAMLRRRADRRGFDIVGFVAVNGDPESVPGQKLLDARHGLFQLARERAIDEVVVAIDDRRRTFPATELIECRLAGIQVTEVETFLERETGKIRLDVLNPSWLIYAPGFAYGGWRRVSHRVLDILVVLVAAVVCLPLMALTALAIKLAEGPAAPVLLFQERVGLLEKRFHIIKFRSMSVNAESGGAPQWVSKDDRRITQVGRFIRMFRIDELPQLWNVLRGEMSIVGPRPERPEFVEQLSERIPFYRERHWVKPGITGWAQLCYSYGASEKDALEKLQYDLYYVKNASLLLDLYIIVRTFEVVLFAKGAR